MIKTSGVPFAMPAGEQRAKRLDAVLHVVLDFMKAKPPALATRCCGPNGELIPLAEQNRALWDRAAIAEGTALLTRTLAPARDPRIAGHYRFDAARAHLHEIAGDAAAAIAHFRDAAAKT